MPAQKQKGGAPKVGNTHRSERKRNRYRTSQRDRINRYDKAIRALIGKRSERSLAEVVNPTSEEISAMRLIVQREALERAIDKPRRKVNSWARRSPRRARWEAMPHVNYTHDEHGHRKAVLQVVQNAAPHRHQ